MPMRILQIAVSAHGSHVLWQRSCQHSSYSSQAVHNYQLTLTSSSPGSSSGSLLLQPDLIAEVCDRAANEGTSRCQPARHRVTAGASAALLLQDPQKGAKPEQIFKTLKGERLDRPTAALRPSAVIDADCRARGFQLTASAGRRKHAGCLDLTLPANSGPAPLCPFKAAGTPPVLVAQTMPQGGACPHRRLLGAVSHAASTALPWASPGTGRLATAHTVQYPAGQRA